MTERQPVLEAKNLTRTFPAGRRKKLCAVSDVSLEIYPGETLGLVGESGCGKSTLGRMLVRLTEPDSGEIFWRGRNITAMPEKEFGPVRRELQFVFQDPYASLNPRMTVRELIAEPLRTYRICASGAILTARVLELMKAVGIPENSLYRYPHQFSGGQRQRIGIARAIALDPALVVCDEPVSALDVSVQNQILNLLNELQESRQLSYLFISHDLSVIRHIADRVCVMFLGQLCETGPAEEVYENPMHPYTRFLLNAIPDPDPRNRNEEIQLLSGEIPSAVNPPSGCRFRTRCPHASGRCAAERPVMRGEGLHQAACHYPLKSETRNNPQSVSGGRITQ